MYLDHTSEVITWYTEDHSIKRRHCACLELLDSHWRPYVGQAHIRQSKYKCSATCDPDKRMSGCCKALSTFLVGIMSRTSSLTGSHTTINVAHTGEPAQKKQKRLTTHKYIAHPEATEYEQTHISMAQPIDKNLRFYYLRHFQVT
jgi:hypothetical protein